MLVLPHSIVCNELEPVSEFFPLGAIINSAKKVQRGLGDSLTGAPSGSRLLKIYLTGRQAPGRAVFLLQINSGDIIPVLVRLKKDAVGKNMGSQNPAFCKALEKNFALIREDLKSGNFDLLELV
jgi:hypothetical protein